MQLVEIPRETWINEFSESAFVLGFNEQRPKERERITRALLIIDGTEPVGYATILEINSNWAYVQYSAVFSKIRRSIKAFIGFKMVADNLKTQYDILTANVDVRNHPAIKAILKLEFIICGYKTIFENNYVELKWERDLSQKLLTDFLKTQS